MNASFGSALLLFFTLLAGCQDRPVEVWTAPGDSAAPVETVTLDPQEGPAAKPHADSGRVLVVVNKRSQGSLELGNYYRTKRGIPKENVVMIDVITEEILKDWDVLRNHIIPEIRKGIEASEERIDYIVLTRGIPILMGGQYGHGLDAQVAAMDIDMQPLSAGILDMTPDERVAEVREHQNPYYNARERFDSSKFGMYLVTRLDGYSLLEAKRLVDSSLLAKREEGLFFFDEAANRKEADMGQLQAMMKTTHDLLLSRGLKSSIDTSGTFQTPDEPLMGYVSWGSNDSAYLPDLYKDIRFKPGSIAETFVSTSARTFKPVTEGQSVITDLIRGGVTGVKGYVSEPYTFALAHPPILFDRYTRGWNLAESFYAASPVIHWKDIVIGDPLCAPYAAD